MIKRTLQGQLWKALKGFPVLTLTGPRQSGKTTLVKDSFPDYKYYNLENPETLGRVKLDPRSIFRDLNQGIIIDEVQKAPELFSWAQVFVDELQEPGKLILTGSNQFEYMQGIGQSLAGRTAVFKLLPLALEELDIAGKNSWETYATKGFYPRLYKEQIDPQLFYSSYVMTYLERDVRNVMQIKNLREFSRFVSLCAHRTGQLLNLSSLALDCAVDTKTISSWISILEASYLIYLLKPHYNNLNKRLIKAPKLYFLDVGLASYLMGIRAQSDAEHHPLRGELFETMVVGELIKYYLNRGIVPPLSFFRDSRGHEIDIIISRGNEVVPIEIKSGSTINPAYFSNLNYFRKLLGQDIPAALVFGDRRADEFNGIRIAGWDRISSLL
ncbi:MAG TPA: ATP-binding protein [Candidatus Cloacimonadota bacterium]|nr:ATP-binding protein [Candidatus Cloacimonadota bacterium]